MNVHVKLCQYDLLEGTETVLCEGPCDLEKDTLFYWEDIKNGIRHEVTFDDEKIILKRFAEISSETVLPLREHGEAKISSPYGDFRMETALETWAKEEDYWTVTYRILQDGQTVTRQKMIWELRGLTDE